MRPLAPSGRGTHRDSAVVGASVAKVGVLGALATATIAVPLASATAGQSVDAASVIPMARAHAAAPVPAHPAVRPAAAQPVAIPVSAPSTTLAGSASAQDLSVTAAPKPKPAVADAEDDEATVDESAAADLPESAGGYIKPVSAPVTSNFGWRVHPVLGYRKLHDGIDFGAACGTPAKAAAAGTVIKAQYAGSSGNRVEVDHGNGVVTGYFHLQSFDVKVGDKVAQGESVGKVGSTGRSTGCHLHFAKMDESGAYSSPASLFQ